MKYHKRSFSINTLIPRDTCYYQGSFTFFLAFCQIRVQGRVSAGPESLVNIT
jgi:hypothetical protein